MNNLKTYEEFLNESNRTKRGNNKINFLKDSTSEVDHTRLVKWMGKNIDSKKYYFEKSKTVGYWILDVEKLSERELKDLLQYLESEKYKFGTQIWLPAYESEINEANLNDMINLVKDGFGWATDEWVRQCPMNRPGRMALAQALAKDGMLFSEDDLTDKHINGEIDPNQDGIKPMSIADAKKLF